MVDHSAKVLVISTTFPPRGGSSVQRITKFIKYLPNMGYLPVVVTCQESGRTLNDVSLLADIPNGTDVYRLPKFFWKNADQPTPYARPQEPTDANQIRKKTGLINSIRLTLRRLLFPDEYAFWLLSAVKTGREICRRGSIDLLFTSFGSPSALFAGYALKKLTGKPWIVDIRDMWSLNPIKGKKGQRPFPIGLLDRFFEPILYRAADRIIVVSDHYQKMLIESFRVKPEKISIIYNGFDEDDFKSISLAVRRNEKFTIRYVGFLLREQRLDGFLKALDELDRAGAVPKSQITVEFVGGSEPDYIERLFKAAGLTDCLSIIGYQSHLRAIELMASADLLLLVPGTGKGTITGKFFEYMRSCTPILMLDQENIDARNIITHVPHSCWVPSHDHVAISRVIQKYYQDFLAKNQRALNASDLDLLRYKFSRESLTRSLAADLDRCLSKEGGRA